MVYTAIKLAPGKKDIHGSGNENDVPRSLVHEFTQRTQHLLRHTSQALRHRQKPCLWLPRSLKEAWERIKQDAEDAAHAGDEAPIQDADVGTTSAGAEAPIQDADVGAESVGAEAPTQDAPAPQNVVRQKTQPENERKSQRKARIVKQQRRLHP